MHRVPVIRRWARHTTASHPTAHLEIWVAERAVVGVAGGCTRRLGLSCPSTSGCSATQGSHFPLVRPLYYAQPQMNDVQPTLLAPLEVLLNTCIAVTKSAFWCHEHAPFKGSSGRRGSGPLLCIIKPQLPHFITRNLIVRNRYCSTVRLKTTNIAHLHSLAPLGSMTCLSTLAMIGGFDPTPLDYITHGYQHNHSICHMFHFAPFIIQPVFNHTVVHGCTWLKPSIALGRGGALRRPRTGASPAGAALELVPVAPKELVAVKSSCCSAVLLKSLSPISNGASSSRGTNGSRGAPNFFLGNP